MFSLLGIRVHIVPHASSMPIEIPKLPESPESGDSIDMSSDVDMDMASESSESNTEHDIEMISKRSFWRKRNRIFHKNYVKIYPETYFDFGWNISNRNQNDSPIDEIITECERESANKIGLRMRTQSMCECDM